MERHSQKRAFRYDSQILNPAWAILKAGHKAYDCATIKSVWRDTVADPRGFKYIHAENYK